MLLSPGIPIGLGSINYPRWRCQFYLDQRSVDSKKTNLPKELKLIFLKNKILSNANALFFKDVHQFGGTFISSLDKKFQNDLIIYANHWFFLSLNNHFNLLSWFSFSAISYIAL